jgi:hypothetical protein
LTGAKPWDFKKSRSFFRLIFSSSESFGLPRRFFTSTGSFFAVDIWFAEFDNNFDYCDVT